MGSDQQSKEATGDEASCPERAELGRETGARNEKSTESDTERASERGVEAMEVGEASENRKPLVLTHHNSQHVCALSTLFCGANSRRAALDPKRFTFLGNTLVPTLSSGVARS
eukprot:scaffold34109_cov73-Phaeocystis_antarctica.AAC.10